MGANTTRNLQDRTDAKLRYADIYIREIDKLAGQRGTDADRAHQESFLYHLAGSLEAFLAEINCYYGCGLPAESISPGNLRKAIKAAKGENAPELVELHKIEANQQSWLYHAKAMRHHCTHVGGVPRVINLGGSWNGQVWLRNPESKTVIEQDFPDLFKQWRTEAGELIARLRAQALAQMATPATAT